MGGLKLKNTYSDALQNHINKTLEEFILFITQLIPAFSIYDPNLQNTLIKTKDGKEIRKSFVSEKNNILISADYNQIEMRILADLADVKELKKAFKNSEDIHSLTASQVFGAGRKKVMMR